MKVKQKLNELSLLSKARSIKMPQFDKGHTSLGKLVGNYNACIIESQILI